MCKSFLLCNWKKCCWAIKIQVNKYKNKKYDIVIYFFYTSILYTDDSTTGVTPEYKYDYEICFTNNFKDCAIIVRDIDDHNIVCVISNIENNIQDVVNDN